MAPESEHTAPVMAYLCLTLSMALVGLYVGLSPLLVAAFPVMLLAWLRFAMAAVAMVGWVAPQPSGQALNTQDHALLFLQSLLGNFLFTLLALKGTALAGATSAGVVMAGIPACVALLSRIFLKEALSGRVWWAAGCTAAAVTMLALQRGAEQHLDVAPSSGLAAQPSFGTSSALGHLLLLGAVVCEASYVVIGKRLSTRVSARRVTAIINLWGLALSTPLGLWAALHFNFLTVQPAIWALLVFYALAASMITVWLWMKGLQRVPAQKAGIFTVFLPLSSAAVGVGFLNEDWGPAHAAALALALLAVWLVTQPGRAVPSGPSDALSTQDQTPRARDGY